MATISENLQIIKDSTNAIKQAIIYKGGSINGDISTWADAIEGIQTGGEDVIEPKQSKDINFYDYDGTILYSYTTEEFKELSSLPPLPTHQGLICQGWNYTLEDISDVQDVGAIYVTDDNKTRLYIHIETPEQLDVEIRLNQNTANGVTIDWGDGSTSSQSSTGHIILTHIYNNVGYYCIVITKKKGTVTLGRGSSSYSLFGSASNYGINLLYKVELGAGIGLDSYTFNSCASLRTITIPEKLTELKTSLFQNCYSLVHVNIPKSITTFNNTIFYNCYSLRSISLNSAISQIGSSAMRNLHALKRLVLPTNLTSISTNMCQTNRCIVEIYNSKASTYGNVAFSGIENLIRFKMPPNVTSIGTTFTNNKNLRLVDFRDALQVPTLTAAGFDSTHAGLKIVVPDLLYDEWVAATNWSNYASYIIKKSDYETL